MTFHINEKHKSPGNYDCSITERKGCNYCNRGKEMPFTTGGNRWYVNDCRRELQADNEQVAIERIKISYCPICGKKL